MGVEKIQAGDKYDLVMSLSQYAGYNLTKTFNNQGSVFTIAASEDPAGTFTFSELSSVTSDWPPGDYYACVYATLGLERYTVKLSKAKILADLTAGPQDSRSHVKKTLDALEAIIEGKATKDQQSMSIAGRALARYEIPDLLKWRDQYKAELAQIDRMTGNAETTGKIYARF